MKLTQGQHPGTFHLLSEGLIDTETHEFSARGRQTAFRFASASCRRSGGASPPLQLGSSPNCRPTESNTK
ncbi:hypothetical protein AB1N83_007845 [Pleurotus pulmonarius]